MRATCLLHAVRKLPVEKRLPAALAPMSRQPEDIMHQSVVPRTVGTIAFGAHDLPNFGAISKLATARQSRHFPDMVPKIQDIVEHVKVLLTKLFVATEFTFVDADVSAVPKVTHAHWMNGQQRGGIKVL